MNTTEHKKILSIDEIRDRLKFMNLAAVAEAAGIHKNLVYRLVNHRNATYETVEKLSQFFIGKQQ
jgi:plasmid maintenance system antidote protein VapI